MAQVSQASGFNQWVNPALRGSVPFSLVHSQLLVTVKISESSPGTNWSGAVQDGVSVSVFFFLVSVIL